MINLKRFLIAFCILIISFVLQTTVFQWLSFGGIVPNILIIYTISFGMMKGSQKGLFIGFFSGLLCDIFFGSFIGLNAVIYMYIGYLAGLTHKVFIPDDVKLPIVLIVLGDLLYNFSFYVFMFLLRGRFDLSFYFKNIMLPELIYTIVIALFFYPILLLIYQHEEKLERNRGIRFV